MRSLCLATGIFVLLLSSVAYPHHLPKGDLNGDGQVDFADFLIFADNFDKPYHLQSIQPHHIINVVVRDTIVVKEVVHDNDAGIRAGRMLGYWYLNYQYATPGARKWNFNSQYIFQRVSKTPNADGEFTVYGKAPVFADDNPNSYATAIHDVTVTYIKSEDKYVLRAEADAPLRSITLQEQIRRANDPDFKGTLADLEVKFSIRYGNQRDMTVKLAPYWADTEYAWHLEEPIIEIDYVKAIDLNDPNRVFDKDFYIPINDGFRRCSREEFMTIYASQGD